MTALENEVYLLEYYLGLGPVERAAVTVGLTLFLGAIVLGLFPTLGERGVETARRSRIISGAVGTPTVLACVVLLWFSRILASSDVGVVFAVPIVIVSVSVLALGRGIGYVALGAAVAARLGSDTPWAWLAVGALASSVVAVAPVAGLVLELLVVSVGVGSGVRVSIGGGTSPQRERNVPPANRV